MRLQGKHQNFRLTFQTVNGCNPEAVVSQPVILECRQALQVYVPYWLEIIPHPKISNLLLLLCTTPYMYALRCMYYYIVFSACNPAFTVFYGQILVWFGINCILQGTIKLVLRDDFELVRYPDLWVCLKLPDLSVAVGNCLQHSLQALYIKSEILCAASGIQEHGRGRLARPLGEPAGHGPQELPRHPNAHPGKSLSLIAANSVNARWCSTFSFLALSMHCRFGNAVEQSDMSQACCITPSETLI